MPSRLPLQIDMLNCLWYHGCVHAVPGLTGHNTTHQTPPRNFALTLTPALTRARTMSIRIRLCASSCSIVTHTCTRAHRLPRMRTCGSTCAACRGRTCCCAPRPGRPHAALVVAAAAEGGRARSSPATPTCSSQRTAPRSSAKPRTVSRLVIGVGLVHCHCFCPGHCETLSNLSSAPFHAVAPFGLVCS